MHHTVILNLVFSSIRITFPDANDANTPPLKKSTVVISGTIDNVYTARQNIIVSTITHSLKHVIGKW